MLSSPAALLLAVALLTGVARADSLTPAKYADIKLLMDSTGSANIARQFASASSLQIFKTLRASRPEIPERAIGIMDRELMALFTEKMSAPGGLMEQVIPIYDRYFSHQEIRELLAFYQTPIGRKSISVLPKVVAESMAAGQRWGQSLGPEIERRITAALRREGMLPAK